MAYVVSPLLFRGGAGGGVERGPGLHNNPFTPTAKIPLKPVAPANACPAAFVMGIVFSIQSPSLRMKLFLLASALLLASSLSAQLPASAQASAGLSAEASAQAGLPAELDKLEGTWRCKNCDQTTWSAWSRQPDGTLVNRTYVLSGLDTVDISRLEVRVPEGKFTVLRLTRAGRPTETFRLTRSARYELLWENENLASLQPTLYMNFYGSKRMVLDGSEGGSMDFRRKRQKAAVPTFDKPAAGQFVGGTQFVSAR